MTPEELRQLQVDFDQNVKARLLKGEPPEDAVPAAAREIGLELGPAVIEQVVGVLKAAMAQRRDPDFARKQAALTARIRQLCKAGLSIRKAVVQAQDDVGVQLGAEGTKILVDALEQESERMAAVRVEVVSEDEFERATGQKLKPH